MIGYSTRSSTPAPESPCADSPLLDHHQPNEQQSGDDMPRERGDQRASDTCSDIL